MANPLFNAVYYLTQNPDVFAAGYTVDTAYDHYTQFGADEAYVAGGFVRAPNPWFDAKYYLTQNTDLIAGGVTPETALDHFLTYGATEGRAPDAAVAANPITEAGLLAYAKANPDLLTAFGIEEDATELTDTQKNDLTLQFYTYGYNESRPAAPTVVAQPDVNQGDTFTLTNSDNMMTGGIDVLNGTSGDDTFLALAAKSLNTGDLLDGKGGNNVLSIAEGAIAADAAPTLKNIQTINNAEETVALDLANATGVKQINTTGDDGIYKNAQLATVFGVKGTETEVTVGYAGTLTADDVAQFAVASNGTTAGELKVADITDLEGIAIDVTGKAANTVKVDGVTSLKSIVLTGDGNVDVTAGTAITSFDASAATGNVEFTSGDFDGIVTIKGGSGNDTLDFSAATKKVVVDGGAGNDTITVGNGGSTITGGAGADTINLTSGVGVDTLVYTARTDSTAQAFDTITGFETATTATTAADKIDLSALKLTGEANAIAITAGVDISLALAEGSVDLFDNNGELNAVAYVDDGTNTGVFVDVNGDGSFDAANDMFILLAGTTGDNISDNFIFG